MLKFNYFSFVRLIIALKWVLAVGLLHFSSSVSAGGVLGNSPETTPPVHVSQSAAPLVLLTMARDHSLFFGAYNDLTDLDGSGTIVFNFKPSFEYIGLFNSAFCYKYNGVKDSTSPGNSSYFSPAGTANSLGAMQYPGGCNNVADPSAVWSGNWLNYVTTSRIDAMRVALYGGYRSLDKDSANATRPYTLLRRAYIPQDGHAWAKEYTDLVTNQYDITKYTPYSMPQPGSHHFFGNMTSTLIRDVSLISPDPNIRINQHTINAQGTNFKIQHTPNPNALWDLLASDVGISCSDLDACSNYPPVMRVVLNAGTRVWRWAGSNQPVLDYHPFPVGWNPRAFLSGRKGNYEGYGNLYNDLDHYISPTPAYPEDFTVQVEVCVDVYILGCKKYGNNYKPTGVMHDYGENGSMLFGLLTGSYDNNLSGGRIRTPVGSFNDEIISSTGQFTYKVTPNSIPNSLIKQIDNLRIRNFNNPALGDTVPDYTPNYWNGNLVYKHKYSFNPGDGSEGFYADWGNPIAEMMYEGLRYFANAPKTPEFNTSSTEDTAVGLSNPLWGNPFSDPNKWCAKPSILVVSSPYTSNDSDQLPGAQWGNGGLSLSDVDRNPLDVSAATNTVGDGEGLTGTSRFIGEVRALNEDLNPTIKTINSLSNARGLAPNYPENQGSYYAAGVAYFGKRSHLQKIAANNKSIPVTDTYVVMLPGPNATIQVPMRGNKKIVVEPFSKTLDLTQLYSNPIPPPHPWDKGQYQATNQIVSIFVTDYKYDPATYAYHINFLVNFDNQASGGDFDMDSVAEYDINSDGDNVTIIVKDSSNDARSRYVGQNMGYIISGTADHRDGPYLVVQDRTYDPTLDNVAVLSVPYWLNVPPTPPGGVQYRPGSCDLNNPPVACNSLPSNLAGTVSTMTFQANPDGTSPVLQHPLRYAARWGNSTGTDPTTPLLENQTPEHFAQATNPAALKDAFFKMFQNVLDTSATQGSVTSNSQQTETSNVLYTTSFNPTTFYGEVTATSYNVTPHSPSDIVTYGNEDLVSRHMPALFTDRNIYFRESTALADPLAKKLIAFNYDNVISQPGYSGVFNNRNIVDYLRGDRNQEIQYNGLYRNRQTVLGTTVNSIPLYSSDTGMVYVNANDGMLHAFDSSLNEKFAFIPTSVLTTRIGGGNNQSTLSLLTQPTASHRFYVDGNLAITSKNVQDSTGMIDGFNYLVGFLGRGGKGLFGLPVTQVKDANAAAPNGLKLDHAWEIDATGDDDMGYLLGKPVIERLPKDGTNVVIFGNGYNSVNNQAALYVVRVRDGFVLAKYITCTGGTGAVAACGGHDFDRNLVNGLATPGVLRRDAFVSAVYAGDYLGNVWKFDLSQLDGNATTSSTYYYDGINSAGFRKIFTATDVNGNRQHIVAPVTTAFSFDSTDPFTQNKQFVFFGTGSDLTAADLGTTTVTQTMYGIIDNNLLTLPMRSTDLVQRSVVASSLNDTFVGYKTSTGTLPVRAFNPPVQNDMSNKRGWYMDWETPAGAGIAPVEQVFTAAQVRQSTTPTLVVSSAITKTGTCISSPP